MKSYETARSLFSFLGFCAGALIILGVIVAILGGSATQSFGYNAEPVQIILGAMPGIIMAAVGLFAQAMVQMGRASVDTAEFSQQSLDVARQHMELSKQLLEQGKTTAASFASLNAQRPAATTDAQSSEPAQRVSYADQPEQNVGVETPDAEPVTIAAASATSPKSIAKEEQMPLAPARQEIVYQDGMFIVGGETFRTKGLAMDYQAELEDNSRVK